MENMTSRSFIVVPSYPILIKNKLRNSATPMQLNKFQFLSYLNKCIIYEQTDEGMIQVTGKDIDRLFGKEKK